MPKVRITSPVFKAGAIAKAVAKAVPPTSNYGLPLVKAKTPVDTGLLVSRWNTKTIPYGMIWENNTPYAKFIEYGTSRIEAYKMYTSNEPGIIRSFERNIERNIEALNDISK